MGELLIEWQKEKLKAQINYLKELGWKPPEEWKAEVEKARKESAKQARREVFKALRMACGIRSYGGGTDFTGIKTPDGICMAERENRGEFKRLLFGSPTQ